MLKTQKDLKYNQFEKENKCFSVSWGADVDFYKNIKTIKKRMIYPMPFVQVQRTEIMTYLSKLLKIFRLT